jgi:plasmid stabilization system protein ParE
LMKVARLREMARRDIDDAIECYFGEGDEPLALRFVDDLERALRLITRHPAAGSPRSGYELQLPGVRAHSLRDFPFLSSTWSKKTSWTSGGCFMDAGTFQRGSSGRTPKSRIWEGGPRSPAGGRSSAGSRAAAAGSAAGRCCERHGR